MGAIEGFIMSNKDSERIYHVVVNDEEQYSVWFADRELPSGWHAEGTSGTKSECLGHIGEIWTDIRPRSLRIRMAEAAAGDTTDGTGHL
jgi:MbtH protein